MSTKHYAYCCGAHKAFRHGEDWETPADADRLVEQHWEEAKTFFGLGSDQKVEFVRGWRWSFSCDLPAEQASRLNDHWRGLPND